MGELRYDELGDALGTMLGPSDSILITQSRIDSFAEATEDRQWIHIDPARAAHGHFGTTIAHGYLTLSLVSAFLEQILVVSGFESVINYGTDRVRFPSPVPVDSLIRATGEIIGVVPGDGWTQLTVRVTVERDGGTRPVCVADVLIRYIAPAEG
ncbi:MaoC family dehydratase [Microbacterium sp. A588]